MDDVEDSSRETSVGEDLSDHRVHLGRHFRGLSPELAGVAHEDRGKRTLRMQVLPAMMG